MDHKVNDPFQCTLRPYYYDQIYYRKAMLTQYVNVIDLDALYTVYFTTELERSSL